MISLFTLEIAFVGIYFAFIKCWLEKWFQFLPIFQLETKSITLRYRPLNLWIYWLPNWPANWLALLAAWLTDWLTDPLVSVWGCWLTDWLAHGLTDWWTDPLATWPCWLTDRQIDHTDWLTDWLTHCMNECTNEWVSEWMKMNNQFFPVNLLAAHLIIPEWDVKISFQPHHHLLQLQHQNLLNRQQNLQRKQQPQNPRRLHVRLLSNLLYVAGKWWNF